ncbi:MAG: bacteriocin [Selenomonadaceae bacterium]|nr:bacteriocin [Selenomonadaceae bacterium]
MTKAKIYEIEILNDEQLDNVTGGEGRPQPVKTRELFKKVIDWIKKLF